MKNFGLTVAAVAAFASISTAHADSSGAFVQASAGQARASGHGEFSYGLTGGYRWAVARSFYLGIEGGYQDFGNQKRSYGGDYQYADLNGVNHSISGTYRNKITAKALLLGANAKWDVTDRFFVMARAGAARYRLKETGNAYVILDGAYGSASGSESTYNTRYYAGLGAGFHLMPQLDLQVTYDHFAPRFNHVSLPINNWAASVEYRF